MAWLADRGAWAETIESRLVDARFRYAPRRLPDPRVLVVLVDDASLAVSPTLLGERADEFAERFEQMFQAGASGIAVDFLLPQRWSASQRFSRVVLAHADRLSLAATSASDGQVVGPECIAGLTAAALGPERASALFGFVNIEPDADGVIRRARLSFQDTTGTRRDSFAVQSVRAAFGTGGLPAAIRHQLVDPKSGVFIIDAAVDRRQMSTLSWRSLPDELLRNPSLFRDRLVLIGGNFVGSGDLHRLSGEGVPIEGVFVQALIMNTILEAFPIRQAGIALWLPMLFVAAWVAAQRDVAAERFQMPAWAMASAGAWIVGAVISFAAGWTVPILMPVAAILAAGVAAVVIRLLLRPFPQLEPKVV
jgi:CHASE2 domain-containing sensor protein